MVVRRTRRRGRDASRAAAVGDAEHEQARREGANDPDTRHRELLPGPRKGATQES